MNDSLSQTKRELRKYYLAKRRALSLQYRQEASHKAAFILASHSAFKHSENIACYFSTEREFDTTAIIEMLWHEKKNCYMPIIASQGATSIKNELHFVRYAKNDLLHFNRYQILEPVETENAILVGDLDMVLLPLIAFDHKGNRLGTGGGFYDKTFAFLKNQTKKPLLIGLGFAIQETTALPHDPWDILLDGVITEEGFLSCG